MKSELQKTNISGLSKDKKQNLIINNNVAELSAYEAKRKQIKEINTIKTDITEIKKLLRLVCDQLGIKEC